MARISSLHGPHHVAQKLRSTTFPLKEDRLTFPPFSASREKSSDMTSFAGTSIPALLTWSAITACETGAFAAGAFGLQERTMSRASGAIRRTILLIVDERYAWRMLPATREAAAGR